MAHTHRAGGLPFGAVMATGAVSQLAELAGVGWLRIPALAVTVLVAAWVTVCGIAGMRSWWGAGASLGFGHFTVPVGLGVIAIGTAQLGAGWQAVVVTAVLLAWASTLLLLAVVVLPALAGTALRTVNGVWFIAPAAALADAAATSAWAGSVGGAAGEALTVIAVVSVWAGVGAYALLLAVAAVRVMRFGLQDAPRAAWWIVTGCGGLAAAALGSVAALPGAPGAAVLDGVAVGCWLVASVLLVPTAAFSIRHLLGVRALAARPAWPPAFSTGVYALGTAHVAQLAPGVVALHWLVVAVAVETIIVWAATGALHLRSSVRSGSRSGTPPHR